MIKAMGKVERLFYAKKESIFSPLKRTFSMNAPQARYSNENQTVEQFLKSAITEARKKAGILATEAGLQIKGVMTVIEESETNASRNSGSMPSDADYMLDAESSENYTVVSPQRKSASRQFRVRFAVEEI